jgi:hypothetical protein
VTLEAIEAQLPDRAVLLEPCGDAAQRRALDPGRAQLCGSSTRDQAGALEHLQVPRDRLHAERERLGELVDRDLALISEARQDRPARGIGKRREGQAELIGCHVIHLIS